MRVLFIDSVHSILQERLEDAGFYCEMGMGRSLEELRPSLAKAEGIVIRSRFRMTAEVMDMCPQLKFIARSGSGMENIETEAARDRGIILYNSPEGNCDAVGEHAIAMLLSLFNHICRGNQEVRKGIWEREGNRGIELAYQTVGIIGYGHTGSAFAAKLRGFGCRILAYDKYKSGFGNEYVQECSMDELFRSSTVVSLHLPETSETKYLVTTEWLSRFEHSIYLINTSRGRVVKTDDLVEALSSGKVLGACLDVLEYEKLSFESLDSESLPAAFRYLAGSDKVILSPHVAGWTKESHIKLSSFLAEKILRDFGNK